MSFRFCSLISKYSSRYIATNLFIKAFDITFLFSSSITMVPIITNPCFIETGSLFSFSRTLYLKLILYFELFSNKGLRHSIT